MKLEDLQINWNQFGETDPLWAILTRPGTEGGRWDIAEFFQTGTDEIQGVMEYARAIAPGFGTGRALDFGCGVGRLTQALCGYFQAAFGVDIAPSMIEAANRLNAAGERCRYVLNSSADLRVFEDRSFDFIYCSRVLQHMRPEYSKTYLREFIRVLGPDGVLIFQIPDSYCPVSSVPLPDSAYSAEIQCPYTDIHVEPSVKFPIAVRVRNTGTEVWPVFEEGQAYIRLGYHWLDLAGNIVQWDGARADLVAEVEPGATVELEMLVTTPANPGAYVIEFDMVHEYVSWFHGKGSTPCRRCVVVLPPKAVSPPLEAPGEDILPPRALAVPVMEMYGVPKEEVLAIVSEMGALAVDVVPDCTPGAGWTSYRYCVRTFGSMDVSAGQQDRLMSLDVPPAAGT